MDAEQLQTILSAVLQAQEQRFVQLLGELRVRHSVQTGVPDAPTPAMLSGGTKKRPATRLPEIEAFVEDKEDSAHFEDWLKRFEIALQCTAPKIKNKEKAMMLATKLSTEAVAEFRKSCLPKEVTDFTNEEAVTKLRLLFHNNSRFSRTDTTVYA
jgi:hypothetical protein